MGAGPTRDGVQARPNALHVSSQATSSVHSAQALDWTTVQIPLDPDQGEIVKFTDVWYEQAAGGRREKGRRERGGGKGEEGKGEEGKGRGKGRGEMGGGKGEGGDVPTWVCS